MKPAPRTIKKWRKSKPSTHRSFAEKRGRLEEPEFRSCARYDWAEEDEDEYESDERRNKSND